VPGKKLKQVGAEDKTMEKTRGFNAVYTKHRMRIYWYVYRKISKPEESEDITADTFLKLYERYDEVAPRGEKAVIAWLYTVARNGSIDHLRKQGVRPSRSIDDEEVDEATKMYDDFVEEAMTEQEIGQIRKVLVHVDSSSQEILQLRYEEGMKFKDISQIVGKSEGACKMILYRALEQVREDLAVDRETHEKKG